MTNILSIEREMLSIPNSTVIISIYRLGAFAVAELSFTGIPDLEGGATRTF